METLQFVPRDVHALLREGSLPPEDERWQTDAVLDLLRLGHLLSVELARALGIGRNDLTALRLLRLVKRRPGVTAARIQVCDELGLSPAHGIAVVTRLVVQGALDVRVPVDDPRRRELSLTAQGVAALRAQDEALRRFAAALLDHVFGEGDRGRLRSVSHELLATLEMMRTRRAWPRADPGGAGTQS